MRPRLPRLSDRFANTSDNFNSAENIIFVGLFNLKGCEAVRVQFLIEYPRLSSQ